MNQLIDLDHIQKDRSLGGKFSRSAAGKAVKFREECEFAKEIVMSNKQLQECTADSMKDALMTVAALGLSVNKVNAYAYLTPRSIGVDKQPNGKFARWEKRVVLIPGYRGLMKLAHDSGAISHISAEVVHQKDVFDIELGSHPRLVHKPWLLDKNRGPILGAYCVTTLPNGEKQITWMAEDELLKVRAAAETTKVWDAWPIPMRIKSVIRRAYKQWPKSVHTPEITRAIDILDTHEGIRIDNTEDETVIEFITDEQVQALELVAADFGFDMGYGVDKVLKAYDVQTPAALPANVFDEAKQRLTSFCEAVAEKRDEK